MAVHHLDQPLDVPVAERGEEGGLTEPVVTTVVAEEAPARRRGLIMGFVQAGYPLGAATAGTLAAVLLPSSGWRPLFLIAFAPVLIVLVSARFLRESRSFTTVRAETARRRLDHRPGWRHPSPRSCAGRPSSPACSGSASTVGSA